MSDRNPTFVTDSGDNTVVGGVVGIAAVVAALFFIFGGHPAAAVREDGPTVSITTPAPMSPPALMSALPKAPAAGG